MKQLFRSKKISTAVAVVVSAAALLALMKLCSSPAGTSSPEFLKSGGDTVDVAIEYSPVSMYYISDSLGGFNYDVLTAIASKSGIAVKIHPVTSVGQALAGLDEGLFDIVVADFPMTLDFQERYRFTQPVFIDRQVLLQHVDSVSQDSLVTSVLDLAGRHVWVSANTPIESRLRNLSSEIGDTIYVESTSEYGAEQLYLLTSAGEIPLSVVNERLAQALATDSDHMRIMTDVSFNQFQVWALRRDNNTLASQLDSLILDFKSTSEYDDLTRRYFGSPRGRNKK